MDKKVTGIVGYITWIGLVVALLAGDKEGAKFHLNQSLVLWIVEFVLVIISRIAGYIPVVGLIITLIVAVLQIVLFVFWIMGLVHAIKEEEIPLPIIGGITILK